MPKYVYKAKTEEGEKISGQMQAMDENDLHLKLRQEKMCIRDRFYFEVNRNQTTWRMSPILRIKTEVKENKPYYTFTLMLPDVDEISGEHRQYLYTSNVTAANLNLDKESSFADSYFGVWAKIIKGDDETSLNNCMLEWDGTGTLEEKIQKVNQGYLSLIHIYAQVLL